MRAVEPTETRVVEASDGVRIAYEVAVRWPMLPVHGSEDRCQPPSRSRRPSELTGAPLVVVDGAGHMIPGRHPVLANLLIRDFTLSLAVEAVP